MSKLKYLTTVVSFFVLLQMAHGEDPENLVVGPDETVNLTSSSTYGTITVRGTLNVSNGAKINATTVNLGPEVGDRAVVNVDGDTTTFGDVKTVIVAGANGGTGKLVAPDNGTEHVGMWETTWAFAFATMTISANAAVGADGYIDVLELKRSATSGGKIANEHATGVARITATGNVRFGGQQYWGGTFFSGKVEVAQKTSGKTLYLGPRYAPMTLAGPSDELVFRDFGAICVNGIGDDTTQGKLTVNAGVSWLGQCDLRIDGSKSGFALGANDALPYGAGKGLMRVTTSSSWLDLKARTQHLNGLEASSGRSAADGYAVTGSAGSKLIFGADDMDGSVSGAISPVVAVGKIGTGVLIVSNAVSMGAMTVSAGTLHVKAAAEFTAMTVAPTAKLVIDGVTLTLPAETSDISGSVEYVNGGKLMMVASTETDVRLADFSALGTLCKAGAGALTLENPTALPSDVKVEAGTLTFSGRGYAIPLYRFSTTKWYGTRFGFLRFALVDADGARACTGLVYKAAGTAVSTLKPGEVTVPEGYVNSWSYWTAASMFSDQETSNNCRFDIASPVLGSNGVTEVNFTFAPPADSNPGVAYNWSPCWVGHPIDWRLLASFDGGESWTAVDEHVNFSNWYMDDTKWVDGGTSAKDVPPAFSIVCADPRAATPVESGMPAAMRLEVSAGSRADFGTVSGGQVVNGLVVDMDGAGSVSNIVFAATGALDVTGDAGALDGSSVELPLVVEGATGAENLKDWNVTFNGRKISRGIALKDGRLLLSKLGMIIFFR